MLSRRTLLLTFAVPVAASLALAGPALAADKKGDKAILKAGVITKADVPADWTSAKSTPAAEALKGVKECRKINAAVATAKNDNPRTASRKFSNPVPTERTTAQDVVYAFRNENAARRFVSAYQSPSAIRCFQKLANEIGQGQPTAGPPAAAPITDLQGVGDQSVGYEITVTVTAQEIGMATQYFDFVIVRVGRAVMGFGFANVNARIPQGPDIVNAVVQRVSAAEA